MYVLFIAIGFFTRDIAAMQKNRVTIERETGLKPYERIYRNGNAFCVACSESLARESFMVCDAIEEAERALQRYNQIRVSRAKNEHQALALAEHHEVDTSIGLRCLISGQDQIIPEIKSLAVGLEDLYRRDVAFKKENGKCFFWYDEHGNLNFGHEAKDNDFSGRPCLRRLYIFLRGRNGLMLSDYVKVGTIHHPQQQEFFLSHDSCLSTHRNQNGGFSVTFASCCDVINKKTGWLCPRGLVSYPVQGAIDLTPQQRDTDRVGEKRARDVVGEDV